LINSSDQSKSQSRNRKIFFSFLFGTLAVIIVINVILISLATVNNSDEEFRNAAAQRAYDTIAVYAELDLQESSPDTEFLLNNLVDQAFAPAYSNIDSFADFHYSVRGEYAELYYSASGELEEKIAELLFAGLESRLQTARNETMAGFLIEIGSRLESQRALQNESELTNFGPGFQPYLDQALADMQSRFQAAEFAMRGAGGLSGAIAVKTISTSLAKKILAVTAAKTAGKLAMKSTGIAGTATSGAAIGTVALPGVGTAVGGVAGAIIGWFGVDKIIVEINEYFNRDEFELELTNIIDEQKEIQKIAIRNDLVELVDSVRGSTPADLINN